MPENPENNFKTRIDRLLKRRKWSMREFARKLGRSQQSVFYTLQRNNPKVSTLKEFAAVLKVKPESLL